MTLIATVCVATAVAVDEVEPVLAAPMNMPSSSVECPLLTKLEQPQRYNCTTVMRHGAVAYSFRPSWNKECRC